VKRLFVLFTLRNYRWYFGGQVVSLSGSWMMQTAIIWLVYKLTHSAFHVGLIAFVGQLPTLLLSPMAGVWIDRLDRIKILLATQVLAAVHALVLGLFVLAGEASFVLLAAFAALQGVISAFDLPTRQVLSFMLAEKREHVPAIISMNSSLINLGRLIGPTLAGVMISVWGPGVCFFAGSLGFLAVSGSVLLMNLAPSVSRTAKKSLWTELREGLEYVEKARYILYLILVSGTTSVFGLAVFPLMPSFAEQVFSGSGKTLGLLMSSFSAGAVVSGFYLACRSGTAGLEGVIVSGHLLSCVTMAFFAFSTWLPLSLLSLFLLGVGCVMVVAPSNSLVQNRVEENKRGRVMSLYSMSFQGGIPLGALIAGFLAQTIGLRGTSCLNAAACLLSGLLFYLSMRGERAGKETSGEFGIVPASAGGD